MANARPSVDDLKRLVRDVIFPFYQIDRQTPLPFSTTRRENDAEHSWSVALLACALAPHIDPKLDNGKVAQFATVHDLVEVYAGDTSNFARENEKALKDERERAALDRLKDELSALPWICQTIETYEAQLLEEAKFVKSVDKLLALLYDVVEEGALYRIDHITLADWRQKLQNHRKKAGKHPGVFAYYDELWNFLLANPQFFYQAKT